MEYFELTWENVLAGYIHGIFPMGNENGSISWFEANPRAVIPLGENTRLKIPRSLRQIIRKNVFEIRHNTEFAEVIRNCASRENTWINELVINAFCELHDLGFGHSIEAWKDGELAGGLYGVAFRGAFFGESMFHKVSNSSKICVVNLFENLNRNNYRLLDIQMMTPHFKSLGAVEISAGMYLELLDSAMSSDCNFNFKP